MHTTHLDVLIKSMHALNHQHATISMHGLNSGSLLLLVSSREAAARVGREDAGLKHAGICAHLGREAERLLL
jgi:hypothetical protein